jgi:acyl-CoA thioesterase FadM
MGMLLTVNLMYGDERKSTEITAMTVYLNVRYKAPVETPGTIVAEAWVESVVGRKVKLQAEIRDGKGKVCALAEAMFVEVPSSRM